LNTKKSIIDILHTINRPGKDKIIEYLEGSTFFTDPASCSEHNVYDGGLADHSMNVYQILERNCSLHPEMNKNKESIKIIGLLHDVCHIGTFQKVYKNITVKGANGKNKLRENGRLLFIEKEGYDLHPEAQLPYPRGTLSTMLIKQNLKLNKLEDLAIQWHAGVFDQPQHLWDCLKRAQKTHKLIFMLYAAKREAILYHDIKIL